MRSALIALLCSVCLCACGDNPDAPVARNIVLSGSSLPGSTITVWVDFRVHAADHGGEWITDPVSVLVSYPPGALFVPGSSALVDGTTRPPDAQAACADGRSYLLYNFLAGEIDDSFKFDDFDTALRFNLVIEPLADEGEVVASAEIAPPGDPCAPPLAETARARINVSG